MEIPAGCLQEPVRDTNELPNWDTLGGEINRFDVGFVSSAATSSWIQVNLNQIRKVTGIVIQGCPQSDSWITKFKLQHSVDGATWTDYTADGTVSDVSALDF